METFLGSRGVLSSIAKWLRKLLKGCKSLVNVDADGIVLVLDDVYGNILVLAYAMKIFQDLVSFWWNIQVLANAYVKVPVLAVAMNFKFLLIMM